MSTLKYKVFGVKGRQTLEVLGIALGVDGSWAWKRGHHISLFEDAFVALAVFGRRVGNS